MANASTLNRQKQSLSPEDKETHEKELAKMRKIEKYIGQCQSMYYHRLLSSVTRHSYDSLFEEVREKQRLDWAESNVGYLQSTIAKAEAEERRMHEQLERERKGRFNEADIRELQSWFQDDSLPEMTRSKLLDEKIAEFIAKFDVMARKRKGLLDRLEDLSDSDAQDVATLRSDEAFFALDASSRKGLMDRIEAMDLASIRGKKHLFSETRTMLQEASDGEGRYVSAAETGTMLKKMMASDKPELHHKETLLPSLRTYKDTRMSFDTLLMEMSDLGETPINPPTVDAFVKWNTAKRSSFLAESRRRISSMRSDKEVLQSELDIAKEHAEKLLKREDWEEAEAFLRESLEQFPNNTDLGIMEAYLHEHRTDADDKLEEKEMDLATQEIDAILTTVHPELRTLYIAMILEGADTFERFADGMRRGVVHKRRNEKSLDLKTPVIADDRPEDDEEEAEDEIKEDDDTEEQLEIASAVANADERERVLSIASISADTQEHYGREINQRIQSKLRQLEEGGRKYGKAA